MARLSTFIIICFVLISTILTFVHSDQVSDLNICSVSLCVEIKICPPGTYLSPKKPLEGICCDSCVSYAKLGEHCNETINCSPNLLCPMFVNGYYSPESECTYFWKNMEQKCDTTYCPTYESCPNGTTLVRHNGENVCCDQCHDNAKYGEYCDATLPCIDGLHCTDNVCTESDICVKEKQLCEVYDCGSEGYILPANGLDRCCDSCGTYAKLGEWCDSATKWCESNNYCDSYSNTCTIPQVACSCVAASESDCVNGVWVPESDDNCCPYCKLNANYGEFCNDETPCMSKLVCKNNTCDVPECIKC